jgi:hypothetical protein
VDRLRLAWTQRVAIVAVVAAPSGRPDRMYRISAPEPPAPVERRHDSGFRIRLLYGSGGRAPGSAEGGDTGSPSPVFPAVDQIDNQRHQIPVGTPPHRASPAARIGRGNGGASDNGSACVPPLITSPDLLRSDAHLNTYWPTQLGHAMGRHFAGDAPSAKAGRGRMK